MSFAGSLWEILVPQFWNPDTNGIAVAIEDEHHYAWDEYVRSLANGLTILKPVKGQWVSPDGDVLKEPMIPVRIVCDDHTMHEIILFTLSHYEQKAVMAYRLSNDVRLVDASHAPRRSEAQLLGAVKKLVYNAPMYSSFHVTKSGRSYSVSERHYPGVEVEWKDVIVGLTHREADMLVESGVIKYWLGAP